MNRCKPIIQCVFIFVVLTSLAVRGAEFALVPVDATGPHTILGREIIVQDYRLQVTLELRISEWAPQLLHVYQAQIDSSGYASGLSGFLEPLRSPDPYAGAFIDVLHPEYIFSGLMVVTGPDVSQPDYRYGGLTWDHLDSVVDFGFDRYAGTLILDVSTDAAGTFVVGFLPSGSFMRDEGSTLISPLVLRPAMITVDVPVITGNCCTDFPGPVCAVTTNSGCAQQGGLFTADGDCFGGAPCPTCVVDEHCDDLNDCTDDYCLQGVCERTDRLGGCDDGDSCTSGDVCTDGVCRGQPRGNCCRADADCNDGVFCNGVERCAGWYCVLGQPPCPLGLCDESAQMCVGCNGDVECNDGLFCNGYERCFGGRCTVGANPCLGQVCDEVINVCTECVTDGDCDDGSFCSGVEQCFERHCIVGLSPCPEHLCDEEEGACGECAADGDCDDGLFCNGSERCVDRVCAGSDDDPCPEQFCSESRDACVECLEDADCDDSVPCTQDGCELGMCFYRADDGLCPDDGIFCTGRSICDARSGCEVTDSPCAEDEICNEVEDRCDQCMADNDCDDGRFCNGQERCLAGACVSGPLPCPDDLCDEFGDGCVECLLPSACDDGDPCTIDDCAIGDCEHTPNPECDTLSTVSDEDQDGVADTADACPSTAPFTLVDLDGCSCAQRDNDGDGVSDCEDQCPDTLAEERVAQDGCPLPTDDNVVDLGAPGQAAPAEVDEVRSEETDMPVEAAAPEEDLSAVSAGGPNLCGSIAFLPTVFLIAGLATLRCRSRPQS